MTSTKLALTGSIFLLIVAAIQYARAKRDEDGPLMVGVFGAVAALLVWIPPVASDWLLGGAAILVVLLTSRSAVGAVATAVALLAARRCSSHGVFVGVLALLAGFTLLAAFGYGDTLRRLKRGRALRPGEHPDGEVEVTGRALAQANTFVPGKGGRCAFWIATARDDKRYSAEYATLTTDAGAVKVRLADATVDRLAHTETLVDDAASEAARMVGFPDADAIRSLSVQWVEPDATMYVTGRPVWEPAPVEGHGYRDSLMVPVFRKYDAESPYLFEGTEDDARALNLSSVVQCLTLTACFSAVAAARVAGWLR